MSDILKRRQREQTPRMTFYYDAKTAQFHCTDGRTWELGRDDFTLSLGPLSARGDIVIYYTCGTASETAPAPDWYREPVAHGWTLRYRHDVPARRVATYTRDGHRIDLRHSPAWWDDCRDAALMARAHRFLERRLRAQFGEHALLLGTPAQTGLDLLDRSLPFGQEYPVLPEDVRSILHGQMTQARRELYPHESEIPSFMYYDARFAYAACLRHLPCQFKSYDSFENDDGEYLPYTPAFYYVGGYMPDDWRHIGLVPRKVDPDDPESGWTWPRFDPAWNPEYHFGWLSDEEYMLAVKHGWKLEIGERITFAPRDTPGCDPLETWQKKLVALWRASKLAQPQDEIDPLHAAALRNIVLHTIGACHRRDNKEVVIVPEDEYVFDPAFPPKLLPGLGYEITRPIPVSAEMARYDHPEWSAYVWARQRARLASQMLATPFDNLLGCNTDAYYTTRNAGVVDDGKIGSYRLKGRILSPRPAPQDYNALLALKEESERDAR